MAYKKKIKAYAIKRGALLVICILSIAFIFFAGYFYYSNYISAQAAKAINKNDKVSPGGAMVIARAKQGMAQGELVDITRVEMVEIPQELVPNGAITSLSKLNGMRLKREVAVKEFLNALDLAAVYSSYEEGDRLIEHNFAEGAIPAAVTEGSAIDIKLFAKGEEDRIVISKAVVVSRNASLLSFYMNEREQEFIKEAASEGTLFAVMYIDPAQSASDVDYIPDYSKEKR